MFIVKKIISKNENLLFFFAFIYLLIYEMIKRQVGEEK